MVRAARGTVYALQPAAAADGAPHRIRREGELEAHTTKLQRVPALPHDPPRAVDQAALHERRERSDRGTLPRRLHGDQGTERKCDDDRPGVCVTAWHAAGGRSTPRVLLRAVSHDDAEPAPGLRSL